MESFTFYASQKNQNSLYEAIDSCREIITKNINQYLKTTFDEKKIMSTTFIIRDVVEEYNNFSCSVYCVIFFERKI